MDLLYTQSLDAFALFTSDSDFTPLVMRILTSGTKVFGFGEKKTPVPFVNACSRFVYTENLLEILEKDQDKGESGVLIKKSKSELRGDTGLVSLLRKAAEQTAEDDGWSHLGKVGQYITNNSSFSPVNYGYKRLSDIVRVSELFHLRRENNVIYIKDSRKPANE
jgi:uncharacterized LabA/DUF88 family protein